MTEEKRTDLKVGVTVLVGIVLFLFGVAWARGWHPGETEHLLRAIFPTVGGLEAGDPVLINGIRQGTVRAVDAHGSDVMVTMAFSRPVTLHADARATIAMLELMGGKKVDLLTGSSSQTIPESQIIPGEYAGDISSLVGMATSMSNSFRSITGKADTLFASLNSFLQDSSLKGNMRATLSTANQSMAELTSIARGLNRFFEENREPLRRTLAQTDVATHDLSEAFREFRPGLKSLLDSSQLALGETRRALLRTNSLFSNFDSLVAHANEKNTLLYRLLRDTQFASLLDTALIELTKLSEQIRRQGVDANVRFFSSSKALP